jgi:Holliday junction DNA helicase RuvA
LEKTVIGRLKGILVEKRPPYLMIEVQGVGYDLEASLATFYRLPEVGAQVTLYTHLSVREDAHTLYGFAVLSERSLFRSLIKVSGVGAKLALLIVSGMTVENFTRCVQENDIAAFIRLPGIGKKTAERLLVEMRDRISDVSSWDAVDIKHMDGAGSAPASPMDDAINALVALGYKLPDAARMVRAINSDGLSSEAIIRQALQATVRTRPRNHQ